MGPLNPSVVCCHASSAAWHVQLGKSFVIVLKGSHRGVGGCLDDCGGAGHQGLLGEESGRNCVSDHRPKVCGTCDVTSPLVSDPGLTSAERRLFQTVLGETWEESFEGPSADFVVDFGCSFSCRIVWPWTRRVWVTRLTPKLSGRRVHSFRGSWHSIDVGFGHELTDRSGSQSNTERVTSCGSCGD